MNLFNARFDITDGGYVDESTYRIAGIVVDNTGNYYGTNVQINDIIYVDGSAIGFPLLRYKVKAINKVDMANVDLNVSWDMKDVEAQEPFAGLEAIIGALHPNGITANLTTSFYNSSNEVLINNASSYQNMLLGNISGGTDLTPVNNRISALEKRVDSVTLEWEEMFMLSN